MKDMIRIEDILDKKGICHDCKKNGIWRLEPYEAEIHEEEYLICLCEECYHERHENI